MERLRLTSNSECGDGVCSNDIGESCDTCPTDCCPFTFPPGATAGIVIFCVLIPAVIALVAAGVSYLNYMATNKIFFFIVFFLFCFFGSLCSIGIIEGINSFLMKVGSSPTVTFNEVQ